MKQVKFVLILIALAPLVSGAKELMPLSPEQKQQAANIGASVEKQCLQGSQPPANADTFIRTIMEWSKDPVICSCVGAKVRDGMTMKVFLYNEAAARQWLNERVSVEGMECMVPVLKQKFFASCETLFSDALKEKGTGAGQASVEAIDKIVSNIPKTCSCAREKLSAISTKEWIDSSMQNYNVYLERKRLGVAGKAPESPLNTAIETCMAEAGK